MKLNKIIITNNNFTFLQMQQIRFGQRKKIYQSIPIKPVSKHFMKKK